MCFETLWFRDTLKSRLRGSPAVGVNRLPMSVSSRMSLGRGLGVLWSANALSNLADGVAFASMPLLAASMTDDPRLVAGLATLYALVRARREIPGQRAVSSTARCRPQMDGYAPRRHELRFQACGR